MELEVLCKMLKEDAQKLKEEKTTLEGMVESHDELIMEMDEEYGLNRMGENDNDEDEDEDDEGNAIAPPAPTPPTTVPEKVIEEEAPVEVVLEQEAPVAHEVILADAKPEPPQSRLFNMITRDYEESPSRMANGPHEMDDPTEACSNMDEWLPEVGSNDQD
jgi:hypothetical protein